MAAKYSFLSNDFIVGGLFSGKENIMKHDWFRARNLQTVDGRASLVKELMLTLCRKTGISSVVWIAKMVMFFHSLKSFFFLFSVPSHMAISSRMSPHTPTAALGMDSKHHPSLPYTTSPYHLSPPAHSSPTPSDHQSTPSPRHDSTTTSPPASSLHSPMWLATPREGKKHRETPANDQDGPLNLSKPRPDFLKRDPGDDRHGHSMHFNGSDKVTTPPPAHSNHRANSNISNSSTTSSNNHSGLSSPIMSTTPPKVSMSEAPSPLFARPPFLPPQYSPFLGLAGHLPVSVLNNNFTAAHSAFLMSGGKLPGMDTDKVGVPTWIQFHCTKH